MSYYGEPPVWTCDRFDLPNLSLGNPCPAHAFENGLKLSKICWVVAVRRPGGSAAGDGVGRVQREAGPGRGARLIELPKLCEGRG